MVAQVASFTSETKYNLIINEHTGEVTGCQCKSFQYGKGRPCKHMVAFDEQLQKAARFILAQNRVREIEETARCYRELAFAS